MDMSFTVSPCAQADVEAAAALPVADAFVRADLLELLAQFPGYGFAARQNGALAGVGAYTGPGRLASCSLFVAPERRRQGMGTALLDALARAAAADGVSRLFCDCLAGSPELDFLTGRGFVLSHCSALMARDTVPAAKDSPQIAPYGDAHFPEAYAAHHAAFSRMRATVGLPVTPAAPVETERAAWLESADERFVYIENGRPVGVLVLDGGYIDAISVDPARWGRGIGAALLRFALAELYRRGYKTARLWVVQGNAAKRLYAREGFAELRVHAFTVRELEAGPAR